MSKRCLLAWQQHPRHVPQASQEAALSATLSQFEPITVLGRGSFGKVWLQRWLNNARISKHVRQVLLVKDKTSAELYAIKAMRKAIIVQASSLLSP